MSRAPMLAWDHLRFALALARHGTLAQAARALRLEPAAARTRLRALEGEAGATLFLPTPSGLQPTDAGRRLLRAAERMAEEMSRVDRALPPPTSARARVRLCVEGPLAALWLRAAGTRLRSELGELELELTSDPAADLSLGWSKPAGDGWTSRRLGALGFALYATAAVLGERGRPRTLASLTGVGWILCAEPVSAARWSVRAARGGTVVMRTEDAGMQLAAVSAGLGVGVLPQGSEDAYPELVRIFPIPQLRPRALWLGLPRDRRSAPHLWRAVKAIDASLGEAVRHWQHRG